MNGKMRAGDVTSDHIGMVVLGVPSIAGWQEYLLLANVEHGREADGKTYLAFRWNDDPVPANTERGKFAIGTFVDPDLIVRVGGEPS